MVLASPVMAQVSVNPGALDQLRSSPHAAPESQPASHASAHSHVRRSAHPATRPQSHEAAAARPATAASAATKPHPAAEHPGAEHPGAQHSVAQHPVAQHPVTPHPVTLAPAPPPAAVLPPVAAPPAPSATPALPVPVLQDAAGTATKLANGIRITFGQGKADLNPATAAALQALAQGVKNDPNVDLNVYAYAAGAADDPSTPRRLSLSRALAARAVLINGGIASTRIYPRALGATPSDGPADHVDVTSGPPASPPSQ